MGLKEGRGKAEESVSSKRCEKETSLSGRRRFQVDVYEEDR